MFPLLAALDLPPADWSLHYERSGYVETGRYQEAVDFCRRLDRASEIAKVVTLGRSPQGREVIALIISKDKSFSPSASKRSRKPLLVFNNGIHSGEIEGKDADLMLAREILITGKERSLIDNVDIAIIPIFSVDAHERFSAYNRINQNGPKEMGWRSTALNLNLNRDFVKADAPEMRGMIRFLTEWQPSFFCDNHTTDGGDWQYVVTADVPRWPDLDPEVLAFNTRLRDTVMPQVGADGFLNAPYFSLNSREDPGKGLTISSYSPRYSHSYYAGLNRPSMLVETHVLKPYKQRVDATYSLNKRTIEFFAQHGQALKSTLKRVDERGTATAEGSKVVLSGKLAETRRPMVFKGFEYTPVDSPITGSKVAAWSKTPIDIDSWVRDEFEPALVVTAPAAYAIPPQWGDVIDLLQLHGIAHKRLTKPFEGTFDTWRFDDVRFSPMPFEGRHMPQFKPVAIREQRTLIPGTVIVPVGQPRAKLILNMMEPEADDSFVRWGFFNALLTRVEYFEDYAMDPYARKMLDADPALKAEFEERLKDPEFAKNPRARLQFFYERSEFEDEVYSKSPIVRLTTAQLSEVR